MTPDYLEKLDILIREKKTVPVKQVIRYKVLDRNDEDSQGLFKEAKMTRLGIKGLTINSVHIINTEDVVLVEFDLGEFGYVCLLYTSPSPRDRTRSRMPSSA